MAPGVLPQDHVVRAVTHHDPGEFSLFLGAGASKSSGIALAGEMIWEWKCQAYGEVHGEAAAASDEAIEAWAEKQPWAGNPDYVYSELFEALYKNPRHRQRYIERAVETAVPSWGYLYLASIIEAGYFNIVYTTNFDDLVNESLSVFLGYNPVVCAVDSQVASINATTKRAKIIKLHGDYLFQRLKNTREELESLDENMERKLREFSKGRGLVVLGYAGRDRSVMNVLGSLLARGDEYFPSDLYWAIREGEEAEVPAPLAAILDAHGSRVHLFHCQDFDGFMAKLHESLELPLPQSIESPFKVVENRFGGLLQGNSGPEAPGHPKIDHDRGLLAERLSLRVARDASELLLYEAQVRLAHREHQAAFAALDRYHEENPEHALSLTIRGAALMVQSEETGDPELTDDAAELWRRAVALEPSTIPARRSLVMYATMRGRLEEAIEQLETLLELSPNDTSVRVNLAQCYLRAHRHDDALEQANVLGAKHPDDAQFLATRASVLLAIGRAKEAVEQLDRALELDPTDVSFLCTRASQLQALGRLGDAEADLRRATELEPNNPYPWQLLVSLYMSTQRVTEGMAALERLKQIAPHLAQAIEEYMQAYMQARLPGGEAGQQWGQGGVAPLVGQVIGQLIRNWKR